MGTASGRGQVRDSVEILVLPPPQAVAILTGGPTAQGRKRTLSGRKLAKGAGDFPRAPGFLPHAQAREADRGTSRGVEIGAPPRWPCSD